MIRDDELRGSIHAALDEISEPVPDLVPGAMARIRTTGVRRRGWVPAAQAVGILAIVATLGGVVLASRHGVPTRQGPATSAPATTGSVAPTAVNPLSCRLPVVVTRDGGGQRPQIATEAGFLNTATGQYLKDAAASVEGLPGGGSPATVLKSSQPAAPAWYSHALGHWLPVDKRSVAPDGRSYVWVRLLPVGSNYSNFQSAELHRYDVARGTDRTLWMDAGLVDVWWWDSAGILIDTAGLWWRIDPLTGAATQQPRSFYPYRFTELPGDVQNGGLAWTPFGVDDRARQIIRIGGRAPGSRDWVFVERAPGQRVWIYQGTQGDGMGFDPYKAIADSTGVWFTDYSGRVLWHWRQDNGLQRYAITGLPGNLAGAAYTEVLEDPAGPCQ